jgi:hypothetical protein
LFVSHLYSTVIEAEKGRIARAKNGIHYYAQNWDKTDSNNHLAISIHIKAV